MLYQLDCTAVILSRTPVSREIPGLTVLPFVSTFTTAAGLLASRFEAVRQVKTGWFFFLDDDDELPDDYLRVVTRCMTTKKAFAFTDELIFDTATGERAVRKSSRYTQDKHIADYCLVHHLVVARTDIAKKSIDRLPRGHFMAEAHLFFDMAQQGGAQYINEIGYIWNKKPDGFHRKMLASVVNAMTWAVRNKGGTHG